MSNEEPRFIQVIPHPPKAPESTAPPRKRRTLKSVLAGPPKKVQTGPESTEWLTVEGVCDRYGVTPGAVRYACGKGNVKARKIGQRLWLIDPDSAASAWADHETGRGPGRPPKSGSAESTEAA